MGAAGNSPHGNVRRDQQHDASHIAPAPQPERVDSEASDDVNTPPEVEDPIEDPPPRRRRNSSKRKSATKGTTNGSSGTSSTPAPAAGSDKKRDVSSGAAAAAASTNARAGANNDGNASGKSSRLCLYGILCIVLILLAGGGAVAVLYFLTDVFDDGEVSPALASTAAPTPTPTASPTPESTPETTGNVADEVAQITPWNNSEGFMVDGLLSIGNLTTGAPSDEAVNGALVDVDASLAPSGAPLNENNASLLDVDLMMTNSSTGQEMMNTTLSFTNNSSLPTFVWQPLNQTIDGWAAGQEIGSFLATSSNGSVIAIGSNVALEQSLNIYKVEASTSMSMVMEHLGNTFRPNPRGASAVAVSLDAKGTALAVGFDDGAVRVFDYDETARDGGEWVQRGDDILLEGEQVNVTSVSVSLAATGRVLVVGILRQDVERLSVQPFSYSTSSESWEPVGSKEMRRGDRLSCNVQLSANGFIMAFTNVYLQDGKSRGAVEIFELDVFGSNNFTERGSFTLLGVSDVVVALSSVGDMLVVTSDKLSTVYDYNEDSERWMVQPGGNALPGGLAVSMSYTGTFLTIGGQDVVYSFENVDSWWRRHASETGDGGFGASVALSGDGSTLVVGSPFDDENGDDAGKVYIFQDQPL